MVTFSEFFEAIPHSRELGMRIESHEPGKAVVSMPYDERLVGDVHSGVIHGGAVSALLDTCAGTATALHPEVRPPIATINLYIAYMRPALPGSTIFAHAECYHVTRSVAFVRASAFDSDKHRPVATATGQFTIGPRSL